MIVKVTPKEAELIERQAALWELDYRKFTMENNYLLVQVEVLNEGREISPETAFHLCSVIRSKQEIKNL